MNRWTDLHTHILPGIDDGAETMEDAVRMAEIAVAGGIGTAAATPHCDFSRGNAEEYLRNCKKTLEELKSELVRRKIPLRLVSGAELRVNEALVKQAGRQRLPGLNRSRWILAEFYFDVSLRYASVWTEELGRLGYRLILAHPERYDFVRQNPENLLAFYQKGIALQVNKGSLFGEFGRSAFRAADWMLQKGIADFVASDAHDPILRTPDLEETAAVLEQHYGYDAAEILLGKNPRRLLRQA